MAQEFTIKSADNEDKINQLLPSQGGFAPGVDFSASTMVVPIVDLTETAEGSALRQDLQTSFGINTTFSTVANTTTTIINTTGYYRIFGNYRSTSTTSATADLKITDGVTTKKIVSYEAGTAQIVNQFDFNIILNAGDSFQVTAGTNARVLVATRQLADINGNLTNPS